MDKLETVIFNALERFKNDQLNLSSKSARQHLAMEIASGIKEKIEKEKLDKKIENSMKRKKGNYYSKDEMADMFRTAFINMNLADKERQEKECN